MVIVAYLKFETLFVSEDIQLLPPRHEIVLNVDIRKCFAISESGHNHIFNDLVNLVLLVTDTYPQSSSMEVEIRKCFTLPEPDQIHIFNDLVNLVLFVIDTIPQSKSLPFLIPHTLKTL